MQRGRVILFTALMCFTILCSGCENTDVKKVISDDVKGDVNKEEIEIESLLYEGYEYLENGEYDEAKDIFNKVIILDKSNKDLYLEIKDKYMELNRYDDAYYFIKLAINNGTDAENMTLILNDIKTNFDLIEKDVTVEKGSKYSLPEEELVEINGGEQVEMAISWSNDKVSTNEVGTYIYEGSNEQYGRSFKITVEVKENT